MTFSTTSVILLIPRHVLDTPVGSESDRRSFLAEVHSEHYGIYDAIASRNSTEAMAAMRAHLEQGRKGYDTVSDREGHQERHMDRPEGW